MYASDDLYILCSNQYSGLGLFSLARLFSDVIEPTPLLSMWHAVGIIEAY